MLQTGCREPFWCLRISEIIIKFQVSAHVFQNGVEEKGQFLPPPDQVGSWCSLLRQESQVGSQKHQNMKIIPGKFRGKIRKFSTFSSIQGQIFSQSLPKSLKKLVPRRAYIQGGYSGKKGQGTFLDLHESQVGLQKHQTTKISPS